MKHLAMQTGLSPKFKPCCGQTDKPNLGLIRRRFSKVPKKISLRRTGLRVECHHGSGQSYGIRCRFVHCCEQIACNLRVGCPRLPTICQQPPDVKPHQGPGQNLHGVQTRIKQPHDISNERFLGGQQVFSENGTKQQLGHA